MSSEAKQAGGPEGVAKQAPTEQQETKPGAPKRFAPGQTVCNEKNEKGKLCNGHLKELNTQHPSRVFLRGDDTLYRCQACGALYMGPPMGHVRDASKQARYVERDLAAILRAAGGTLPAYDYPTPSWRGEAKPKRVAAAPAAKPAAAKAAAAAAPEGETPEQKKARLAAEHKARLAAQAAAPADSSASADAHRPAAEAQAATGQASAAPLSPTAATASPASGAETVSDLAPEASTERTPGAPKDERPQAADAAPAASAEARPKAKKGGGGFKVAPEFREQAGETPEQKIARLKRLVEEAKRAAGKL
ncbi:MAG TPA: hypothetical protein VF668_20550 [Pyrinomonadaceae bacterium]|jgi:hypothetical protein